MASRLSTVCCSCDSGSDSGFAPDKSTWRGGSEFSIIITQCSDHTAFDRARPDDSRFHLPNDKRDQTGKVENIFAKYENENVIERSHGPVMVFHFCVILNIQFIRWYWISMY